MIMIRNRLSEKPAAFGSSRWLWGWFAFIYRPVRIIAIAKASDTKGNTRVLLVLFVMVQFAIGGAIETLAAALCATGQRSSSGKPPRTHSAEEKMFDIQSLFIAENIMRVLASLLLATVVIAFVNTCEGIDSSRRLR